MPGLSGIPGRPGRPGSLLARLHAYVASFPRSVWLLTAATMVESTGRFMVVPYLSLYMKDKGISLGALGLVLGSAPVASVLFGALGGQLSDHLGRKPVQILGVCTSALAMFGFAFAGGNVYLLAVLNFMNGMTRTFYRPATNAALADLCPPGRLSEAFALNRIALNAAFGWGPLLGVAIFAVMPRAGFIVGGALNLAVGLFLALAVPESAPTVAERGLGLFRHRPASHLANRAASRLASHETTAVAGIPGEMPAGVSLDTQTESRRREALRTIAGDAVFWVWMAGMTLVWGAYDLIQSFLPLHMRAQDLPLWLYGSLLSINALVCVLGQLPVSRALRVAPIAPAAGLSKLLFALGFVGFAFLSSPAALMGSMLVLSLGEIFGSAVQSRFVPEHARPDLLGRYMGLTTMSELGRAIVAPAAGFLMQAAGGEGVFVMAAALCLGGGLLLWLAGKARDAKTPGAARTTGAGARDRARAP